MLVVFVGYGNNNAVLDALQNPAYFAYNANGQTIRKQDPLLRATYFTFDKLDQLLSRQSPDGEASTFGYSKRGLRASSEERSSCRVRNWSRTRLTVLVGKGHAGDVADALVASLAFGRVEGAQHPHFQVRRWVFHAGLLIPWFERRGGRTASRAATVDARAVMEMVMWRCLRFRACFAYGAALGIRESSARNAGPL